MSLMNKFKGQSSMEFMVMVAIMLLMLSITITALRDRKTALDQRRDSLQGVSIGDKVANEIDMALTFGEGYYRTFEIDRAIRGEEYTVDVEQGQVVVSWGERDIYSPTSTEDVEGSIQPGENKIKNVDGDIKIE